MTVVKTYEPAISIPGEEFTVESEAEAVAKVIEDGEWLAGIVPDETQWGAAKYGDTIYLWSGPYPEGMGTPKFQVDTFTIGES